MPAKRKKHSNKPKQGDIPTQFVDPTETDLVDTNVEESPQQQDGEESPQEEALPLSQKREEKKTSPTKTDTVATEPTSLVEDGTIDVETGDAKVVEAQTSPPKEEEPKPKPKPKPAIKRSLDEEVQRRVNEELSKRIEAELARRRAEDETARKNREAESARLREELENRQKKEEQAEKEKEAVKKAMEEDFKKRVSEEADRRIKKEMQRKIDEEVAKRLGSLKEKEKEKSAAAAATAAAKGKPAASVPDAGSDEETEESEEGTETETETIQSEKPAEEEEEQDASVVHNHDNGIFNSAPSPLPAPVKDAGDIDFARFEELADAPMWKQRGKDKLDVSTYSTIREEGRCIVPMQEEFGTTPKKTHHALQLGYFQAKQVLTLHKAICKGQVPKINIAKREAIGQHPMSKAAFSFYHDAFLNNQSKEGAKQHHHSAEKRREVSDEEEEEEEEVSDEEGSEDGNHKLKPAADPKLVKDINDSRAAMRAVTEYFSYPDPLQQWELARGKIATTKPGVPPPQPFAMTHAAGGSTYRILVNDTYEPKKPVRMQPIFNNGVLLRVDLLEILSGLSAHHGKDIDPLFGTVAVHSISDTQFLKVSETFHFNVSTATFFPQKTPFPTQNLHSCAMFIPNDFRGHPLYLVFHIFRLSCDNFDTVADMYARPEKYNAQSVVTLKQDTQQLAMYSEFFELLGFHALHIVEASHLKYGEHVIDKILRGPKATGVSFQEYIVYDKCRNQFKALPFTIKLKLTDVSNWEISFPQHGKEPASVETESMISLKNLNDMNAVKQDIRYVPTCLTVLNAGPFNSYTNIFYVRMKSVMLNVLPKGKVPLQHNTYFVQVALKDNDDSLIETGLPAIYTRSMDESIVDVSSFSSVFNGFSVFNFPSDEFKIQLPLVLTERHHLFFTFWAVSLKKGTVAERFTKIGYSFMPIYVSGALNAKDTLELPVLLAEHGKQVESGYLMKRGLLPQNYFVNNGQAVFRCGTSARSSLYVISTPMSQLFGRMPASMKDMSRNDGVFWNTPARLVTDGLDGNHSAAVKLITDMPLPELLAYYPCITSFLVAMVSSPSTCVGYQPRREAFKALVEITHKMHFFEVNSAKKFVKTPAGMAKSTPTIRSSVMVHFYHFITNDALFEGKSGDYPIATGMCEMWLAELRELDASPRRGDPAALYMQRMADISWFLFDIILRSSYIASHTSRQPRVRRFSPSFYKSAGELAVELVDKLPVQALGMVARCALFLRCLLLGGDRGLVLKAVEHFLNVLEAKGNPSNIHTSVRIFLEPLDSVMLSLPAPNALSPRFLLGMCLKPLVPLLLHNLRDVRVVSVNIIYNFLCRAVNGPNVSGEALKALGSNMWAVVEYMCTNMDRFITLNEKDTGRLGVQERRQMFAILLWTLFYQNEAQVRKWMKQAGEQPVLGLLKLLAESQKTFRYHGGKDKAEAQVTFSPAQPADALSPEDARFSTLVSLMAVRIAYNFVEDFVKELQTVNRDELSPFVVPFFELLGETVSLKNSTFVLQGSCVLLHRTIVLLLPELISRKAIMVGQIVSNLLALMRSTSPIVRDLSAISYLTFARACFALHGSLSKLKQPTTASVMELDEQNLPTDFIFMKQKMDFLVGEASIAAKPIPEEYRARFVGPEEPSGDSEVTFPNIPQPFNSVVRPVEVSPSVVEKYDKMRPTFPEEFASLANSVLSLYREVIRLEKDKAMDIPNLKCAAFHRISLRFLEQGAIAETMKWLSQLSAYHKSTNNFVEAGMANVTLCALAFRVTELFYKLKGENSKGARWPFAIFSHVYWHDFVRLLPELDTFITFDNLYPAVKDMFVVPNDKAFTLAGQVTFMKEAAELFGKQHYYELSLGAIGYVNSLVMSKGDFKSSAIIHNAMYQWAGAAFKAVRESQKYFYFSAQLERKDENSPQFEPIQEVFKMPTNTTLGAFKELAKKIACVLFRYEELVIFLDDIMQEKPLKLKKGQVPPNRCVIEAFEVFPVFDADAPPEEYQLQAASHLDRLCSMKLFQSTRRVTSLEELSTLQKNKTPDLTDPLNFVNSQNLVILLFELERAFPSVTNSIRVETTTKTSFGPIATALHVIRKQFETLDAVSDGLEPKLILDAIFAAMTPESASLKRFGSPGAYLKDVISAFQHDIELLDAVRSLLDLVKAKLALCDTTQSQQPEKYAMVLKGVVDIECALQIATS